MQRNLKASREVNNVSIGTAEPNNTRIFRFSPIKRAQSKITNHSTGTELCYCCFFFLRFKLFSTFLLPLFVFEKNNKNAHLTQFKKRNKTSPAFTSDRTSRVQHRSWISERREKKKKKKKDFRFFCSPKQIQEKSIPHSIYSIYKFTTLP